MQNHTFQSILSTQFTRDWGINLNNFYRYYFYGETTIVLDEIERQSSPMVIPLFNRWRSLSKRNARLINYLVKRSMKSASERNVLYFTTLATRLGNAKRRMFGVLFTCQHFWYCDPQSFATGVLSHKKRWSFQLLSFQLASLSSQVAKQKSKLSQKYQ